MPPLISPTFGLVNRSWCKKHNLVAIFTTHKSVANIFCDECVQIDYFNAHASPSKPPQWSTLFPQRCESRVYVEQDGVWRCCVRCVIQLGGLLDSSHIPRGSISEKKWESTHFLWLQCMIMCSKGVWVDFPFFLGLRRDLEESEIKHTSSSSSTQRVYECLASVDHKLFKWMANQCGVWIPYS